MPPADHGERPPEQYDRGAPEHRTEEGTEAHSISDNDETLPVNDAALPLSESTAGPNGQSGLFGRGLLYVVVFSLQTLAATVVSPVLAHLVGPNEFGRLASAIALFQLLSVLAVLGLDQAIVLRRSEDPDNHASRGLLTVSFALTLLLTSFAAATARWWSGPFGFGSFTPLLLATLLWTLGGACVQVMLSLLLVEDRLKSFTLMSVLAAVGGQVFGIVLLLVGSNTAATYAWGGVISQFLALALGLVLTRPRLRGLLDLRTARRAFALGFPLALGGISAFILTAGDRIIVQRLLGPAEVGRYQIAYTIGNLGVLLLVFTSQAWAPRFAAMHDRVERLALVEDSRNQLYRLLIPMLLGLTLGAPVALQIVAPASFDRETLVPVVFLVALSTFPVAASGASGRELFALRLTRPIAIATAAAAGSNVVLNIILVPSFGIAGSAAATVLAFVVQAVIQLWMVPRGSTPWPRTPARIWLGIATVCVLSGASTLLPQTVAWDIGRLLLGLACLPWFLQRLVSARTGTTPTWWRRPGRPHSPSPARSKP